jgi:hypothetical protein
MERMDCEEIRELLDGYALGASDSQEARQIEVHVADCVRCWEELSISHRTAALLALSVRLEPAPVHLEERIIRTAEREIVSKQSRQPFWRRLTLSPWPAAASALGVGSIVALAASGLLFREVRDMQAKNDDLEAQIRAASAEFQAASESTFTQLADQEEVVSILSDSSHGRLAMQPRGGSSSQAFYTWSPAQGAGAMLCEGLPELEPNKVYMIWLKVGGTDFPLRSFISDNGKCQVILQLPSLPGAPEGIGITVEDAPAATERTKPWFMYGHFPAS